MSNLTLNSPQLPLERGEPLLELATRDERVVAPAGIVYSTQPRTAFGHDGRKYFIKGDSDHISFSETAGCRLATLTGLPVPRSVLCIFDGVIYAGVEEVERAVRNLASFFPHPERFENLGDLYDAVAVDVWLGNDDRNVGNIVGLPIGGGKLRLTMIDYEKSKTLKSHPIINASNIEPRKLWPKEDLGRFLHEFGRPGVAELRTVPFIESIEREKLVDLIQPLAYRLPTVNWAENSVDALIRRARRIRSLVQEVWEAT